MSTARLTELLESRGGVTMSREHHEIHEGHAFSVNLKFDIPGNKVGAFSIVPDADGPELHLKMASFSALGGPITISLLEGASFTSGSSITPVNRRRTGTPPDSGAVCSAINDGTVTGSPAPVTIGGLYIPTTTQGSQRLGGSIVGDSEFILQPGESYVIAMANGAGTTSTVGLDLFWYEEDTE